MSSATNQDQDINIVEIWLRWDPKRLIAGVLAGWFAGFIMFLVVSAGSIAQGDDRFFLLRIFSVPIRGGVAMMSSLPLGYLLPGAILFALLTGFLGAVYAHVTGTNNIKALLGMGVTWGLFSWIFISNLFSPSFREVFVVGVSPGKAIFAWLAFGLSLVSVRVFDRILKGR